MRNEESKLDRINLWVENIFWRNKADKMKHRSWNYISQSKSCSCFDPKSVLLHMYDYETN